jgi:hypothetical protein
MKGLLVILPDGRYEVKSFATDDTRKNVCAYGVFTGTHTGPGGTLPTNWQDPEQVRLRVRDGL